MRIAYVYDAVYPWVKGGAERRIYELSRRLAARGHEVHCYGIKWWPQEKDIVMEGVHLHGICAPRDLYSGDRRSIREAAVFASRCFTSLERDHDLLDCQAFPYLPCFPAKLHSLRGPELFITWHEVWGDYWHEYLGGMGVIGRLVEMAVSRLTENNLAVSESTGRELQRLGARSVRVVPNGIDFRRIEKIRPSNVESDVIYVGRLVSHKNVDLLIRAIGNLRSEKSDLRAIIIGDGPERKRLESLARTLRLEGNLEFKGFLESYDDALALMKSSKVFVLPSTREGFGIAALEANACGLPVVTVKHRMNAVCDLVTKETGFVCAPSGEDLAGAIAAALEGNRNRRGRCVDQARAYDWEIICTLAENAYNKRAQNA
jgi:glycosyltransferase involved in cell wall biosynthesis